MAEKRKAEPSNLMWNWRTRRKIENPWDERLWTFDPNEPSPNDPTERKVLNVEDLDLDKSYVGKVKPQARPKRPRYYRPWKSKISNGGVHAIDLPKRWHTREDDLDPYDIDGQIERARDRIEENIRPEIFRHRIAIYERARQKLLALLQEEPNAETYEVARRLQVLRKMKVQMSGKEKDPYCQIPNIDAIINAYETKTLSWNPGLVTYRSAGRKLCEPRPFDWDEFEAINKANDGWKSFWTEGFHGPDPASMLYLEPLQLFPRNNPSSMTEILITLRIPNLEWWIELPFVHDTGASTMTIYQEDLWGLLGPHTRNQPIPLMGEQAMSGFDGNDEAKHYPCIELEATICNRHGERLTEWTRVPAVISGRNYDIYGGAPRVDGPITRSLLYMASAPDGTGRNLLCQKPAPLLRALPEVHLERNLPPINSQPVVSKSIYPAPPPPPVSLPPAPGPGFGPFPPQDEDEKIPSSDKNGDGPIPFSWNIRDVPPQISFLAQNGGAKIPSGVARDGPAQNPDNKNPGGGANGGGA